MSVRNLLSMVAVLALSTSALAAPPQEEIKFVRGDCYADGDFNMEDVVQVLMVAYEGRKVECETACDANGDGVVSTGDAIALMQLLVEKVPLANPFPECGVADKAEGAEGEAEELEEEGRDPLKCDRHRVCL